MEKLETIEIDIPNKVYKINGTPFSDKCHELVIVFKNGVWEINYKNKFYPDGRALRN
ncbi:hypothetical protein SAMN02745784_01829 [Tissierella praeacuta DSM 18095]|uniref:Uncharacterized protein n=1 Tax=Tissierella praeacuta DSM 18095 TaxID=1123404 RepID=A0A1M4WF62_9FIRM|nr:MULTISPECIES: hypothetical protein [Tissierella]SHE79800.1 hypothetical protein SAMN02745784_01829 [Tissierella praeacuta DSM 18095]SUO99487.1 Uncharacterised protein [Tissierella praeacuta]